MVNSLWPLNSGVKNGFGRALMDAIKNEQLAYIPSVVWEYRQLITYTDISTAGLTKALDLNATFTDNAFPSSVNIVGAQFELAQEFSGGAVATMTAELGDTADPNEILTSTNIFTGAGTGFKDPAWGAKIDGSTGPFWFESGYVPEVLFTSTVANLDALTQGQLHVSLFLLPRLARGVV